MAGHDTKDLPFPTSEATRVWLSKNGFESLSRCDLIGSGHHECYMLTNTTQEKIIIKTTADLSGDPLKAEVEGLNLIASTSTIKTPEILHVGKQCLAMEYIEESNQQSGYWSRLAEKMAALHRVNATHGAPHSEFMQPPYGLATDNFCGATRQPNGWFEDGHELFVQNRLLYQAYLAHKNGLLESPWVISVESICERLTEIIPWQPASLLHGDFWPGNILADSQGEPVLIDPAAYYGWREADVAMSLLFGGLPHEFYVSYDEIWPMESGWRNRVPLYNLYHLLNHLNIFGVSYLEQVQQTISRYA